ncbi:hypothetical protein TWF217_003803 [Orbilia oligospora]|nr:hypothetical protein TWF128_006312 [Orbilia oligospora]KAF3271981.1 hypothetical protein TWF217_003803 [Orbilia oligospora]KAF3287212.1 hypothetical protein TWF132_008583 [Orbilia oligospora]
MVSLDTSLSGTHIHNAYSSATTNALPGPRLRMSDEPRTRPFDFAILPTRPLALNAPLTEDPTRAGPPGAERADYSFFFALIIRDFEELGGGNLKQ